MHGIADKDVEDRRKAGVSVEESQRCFAEETLTARIPCGKNDLTLRRCRGGSPPDPGADGQLTAGRRWIDHRTIRTARVTRASGRHSGFG